MRFRANKRHALCVTNLSFLGNFFIQTIKIELFPTFFMLLPLMIGVVGVNTLGSGLTDTTSVYVPT